MQRHEYTILTRKRKSVTYVASTYQDTATTCQFGMLCIWGYPARFSEISRKLYWFWGSSNTDRTITDNIGHVLCLCTEPKNQTLVYPKQSILATILLSLFSFYIYLLFYNFKISHLYCWGECFLMGAGRHSGVLWKLIHIIIYNASIGYVPMLRSASPIISPLTMFLCFRLNKL